MLELSSIRKQKVNLNDYDSERDIAHRMLLSDVSSFELEVIEEILFSPLRISLKKLSRKMDIAEEKLYPLLEKLSQLGLLTWENDQIQVDKDSRKCFEFEMMRFDPSFKPDLEFIQGILRKVPIHFLPTWYALPRTSNNIFESIIEKYLLTPQIFQRYLSELHLPDEIAEKVTQDLFLASDYTLFSGDIISKYNLTRRHFEEIVLLLEFHFIGYLSYRKEEDLWLEVITPFYEWHQYLRFLKNTETPIVPAEKVYQEHLGDFAFVSEMTKLLETSPLKKEILENNSFALRAFDKLLLLKLAQLDKNVLSPTETGKQWLKKSLENRALYLYRHPINIASLPGNERSGNERQLREAEKAIRRALHGGWVLFEDFLKGITIGLNDSSAVMIQKVGKLYRYTFPTYEEKEKQWFKMIFFEWLFEVGMVSIGTLGKGPNQKECFAVTPFGRFCFEE